MPGAHGNGDARACGAATRVTGQRTVFFDKKLWAVEGDGNSHGGGGLIPTKRTVFAEKKNVIVNTADGAGADGLCGVFGGAHCGPSTAKGSFFTFAYGPGGSGGLEPTEPGGIELREDSGVERREDDGTEERE